MASLTNQQLDNLEEMIDQSDLSTVIDEIANICYEKADHILSTWADESLSNSWSKDAAKLEQVLEKLNN